MRKQRPPAWLMGKIVRCYIEKFGGVYMGKVTKVECDPRTGFRSVTIRSKNIIEVEYRKTLVPIPEIIEGKYYAC